jgi:hypothetical protein
MKENDLYTIKVCLEDAQRIVKALRYEAYHLSQESHLACEKGARDYGTILWEESAYYDALSDSIDFIIPE